MYKVDYDGDKTLLERDDIDKTVFVNAANYRSGVRASAIRHDSRIGGPGFQPIVVDLKD